MRRRFATGALIGALALGSLLLWTAIPAAWLWVTRDLATGPRFLVALPACAITMVAAGSLLYRLEVVYLRVSGAPAPERRPPSWLRTSSDDRRPAPKLGLLDTFLAVSAVVALIALVAWWALLADNPSPSGPLQPL